MMTRKDYVKTAEILSDVADVVDDVVLYAIAKDFADYFSQDNPRFNRDKFYSAVGVE